MHKAVLLYVLPAVCLCAVVPALAEEKESNESLSAIVVANEAAIAQIREIELSLSISGERYRPEATGRLQIATWRWAWKGDLERIRYIDLNVPPRDDGLTNNRGDVFLDGNTAKWLRNWDPENPQVLAPTRQGTVKAVMMPQSNVVPGRDVKAQLLWAFTPLTGAATRVSLRKLVEASSPAAELKGSELVGERNCWHITASLPGHGDSGPTHFDIFLDPDANYMVRKTIVRQSVVYQDGDAEVTSDLHLEREVRRFHDAGSGVFIPVEIETRSYEGSAAEPASKIVVHVEIERINEPLSTDAFAFRFPENCQVTTPPVDGKSVVYLWGPDNSPIREIRSAADLRSGDSPEGFGNEAEDRRSLFQRMILGSTVMVGILLFVWFAHLRRKANDSSA